MSGCWYDDDGYDADAMSNIAVGISADQADTHLKVTAHLQLEDADGSNTTIACRYVLNPCSVFQASLCL